jgi:hypothetical protein
MAVIIFRRLENELASVRKLLGGDGISDEDRNSFVDKENALSLLMTYLNSFEWLTHAKTKERVKLFISSRYDYKFCTEQLNMESLSAFETSMWYTAKKFQSKIGENTIDLIMDGAISTALIQFNTGTGKMGLVSILPHGVGNLLPAPLSTGAISISECRGELELLKSLVLKTIKSKLSSLGRDNLAFLRHILESTDVRFSTHRQLLYSYLLGSVDSFDDLLVLLSQEIPNFIGE